MAKSPSPVRLQEELMQSATQAGARHHRSAAEQIEYWAEIAQCGIDNPDLTFSEIKDMIAAVKEHKAGMVAPFEFN